MQSTALDDKQAFVRFMAAAQSGVIAASGYREVPKPDPVGENWGLNMTAYLGNGPSDPVTLDVGTASGRVFTYRGKCYKDAGLQSRLA